MKKKLLRYVCATMFAFTVTGAPAQEGLNVTARDSPELAAFKKAIRAKYDLKERSYAMMDSETLVSRFYAENLIVAGGQRVFVGRKELRPVVEESVKAAVVKVDSVYTFVEGDAGWDWADFHMQPRNPKEQPTTLEILFLWAKINGEWMCMGEFAEPGSFRKGRPPKRVPK